MRIRFQALQSVPTAFASSVDQDRGLDRTAVLENLSHPERFGVFGCFNDAQQIVAMVGVFRETKKKLAHRANIYGMYVSSEDRRQGHARALLHAAVEHARSWKGVRQVHLSVSESASGAKPLYESYGFVEWGREPDALGWKGEFFAEHHMLFQLDSGGSQAQ